MLWKEIFALTQREKRIVKSGVLFRTTEEIDVVAGRAFGEDIRQQEVLAPETCVYENTREFLSARSDEREAG